MNYQPSNGNHIKTLKVAAVIFQYIAASDNGLSLGQLQELVGCSKSAIHRHLLTFMRSNWIEFVPLSDNGGLWRLTHCYVGMAFEWKRQVLNGQGLGRQWMFNDNNKLEDNDTVFKAIKLFHLVSNSGLNGLTLDELLDYSGYRRTTIYRLLRTWESLGWLRAIPVDNRSERWCMSTKLVDIAHQHENQRRRMVAKLHEEYAQVTGEAL